MKWLSRAWLADAYRKVDAGVMAKFRAEREADAKQAKAKDAATVRAEIARTLLAREAVVSAVLHEGCYWPDKDHE